MKKRVQMIVSFTTEDMSLFEAVQLMKETCSDLKDLTVNFSQFLGVIEEDEEEESATA